MHIRKKIKRQMTNWKKICSIHHWYKVIYSVYEEILINVRKKPKENGKSYIDIHTQTVYTHTYTHRIFKSLNIWRDVHLYLLDKWNIEQNLKAWQYILLAMLEKLWSLYEIVTHILLKECTTAMNGNV